MRHSEIFDDRAGQPAASDPRLSALAEALIHYGDTTNEVVGVTDDRGGVTYLNPAARQLLGLGDRPVSELTTADVFPPLVFDIYYEEVRPTLLAGKAWSGMLPVNAVSGAANMWMVVVGGVAGTGEVSWLATIGRDLADLPLEATNPARAETYDPLTGAANRPLLLAALEKSLARAERAGTQLAVVFIDLNGMKAVNDTFGHHAGDEVLIEVAHRLKAAVRPSDTVARLGGDEFVVVCEEVDGSPGALMVARRIRDILERQPIITSEGDVHTAASFGVAIGDRNHNDPVELLRWADVAMYRAKANPHDAIVLFDELLRDELARRDVVKDNLAVGLTQRAVRAAFQPIVELTTNTTVGYHALARWQRDGRLVPAREFIDVAAATGLAGALDLAVLRAALEDHRRFHAATSLHVTLSDRWLNQPDTAGHIIENLARADMAPSQLFVRVNASALVAAPRSIEDLAAHGVQICVRLHDLRAVPLGVLGDTPIRQLVLAPALVRAVAEDQRAARSLMAIASALELSVLATALESETAAATLAELGCHYGQGYLFGYPLPIAS